MCIRYGTSTIMPLSVLYILTGLVVCSYENDDQAHVSGLIYSFLTTKLLRFLFLDSFTSLFSKNVRGILDTPIYLGE